MTCYPDAVLAKIGAVVRAARVVANSAVEVNVSSKPALDRLREAVRDLDARQNDHRAKEGDAE